MIYVDQISALTDALKLEPNSEAKNKTLSKLKDAWVWARMLDSKYKPIPNEPSDCICSLAITDPSCPVYSEKA